MQVVIPETNVPSLTKWGASPLADLVYRTLVIFGPGPLDQVSYSLGLASRDVRAAADELNALGVATIDMRGSRVSDREDRRVWRGIPPAQATTRLRQRTAELAQQRRQLRQRLAGLHDFGAELPGPDLPPHVARPIYGIDRARSRVADLMAAERYEHLSMHPEPAFSANAVKAAAPGHRTALQHNVSMQTLGIPATSADASTAHSVELNAYGTHYRELPTLPMKLMIMDRSAAVLLLTPGFGSAGIWEVQCPATVEKLVDFFLRHWTAASMPNRGWMPPMTLNPRERAIMALLAAGHTDLSVADQLELSVRTIAYTIRNLMDRYEVRNRFQLGLALGADAARS